MAGGEERMEKIARFVFSFFSEGDMCGSEVFSVFDCGEEEAKGEAKA